MPLESNTPLLYFVRPDDPAAPAADYLAGLLGLLTQSRFRCLSPEQATGVEAHEGEAVVLLHLPQQALGSVWADLPDYLKVPGRALLIRRAEEFWNALPATGTVALPPDLAPALQAAANKDLGQYLSPTSSDRPATLSVDLLAACLWILTRAEEYGPAASGKLDAHGRFLASNSAVPLSVYDSPVAARALLWVFGFLTGALYKAGQTGVPAQQNVALTHDVDLLRKFRGVTGMKRLLGRMLREPAQAAAAAGKALPVMLGKGRDPYDSFDDLFAVKDRISAPSTWFLMSEQGGPNADYALSDPVLRNILVRGRGFHDEVAVHSSWDAGVSAERIQKERSSVEKGTAASVRGVRPHYLRFTLPATWQHMAQAGLRYSSSMAFPDRAGFRCGWSGPFRPFDLVTMREIPIIEIPLVCMDVTLSVYEKVPAELSLERLTNLLDASCEGIPGGAFVFLWHNTIADRTEHPGYWDTFEYFFSIASGSSTFVTLNQLCDDFEVRNGRVR